MTLSMPQTVWVFPVPGGPWTRVNGHGSCFLAVCRAAHLMEASWGELKERCRWSTKLGVKHSGMLGDWDSYLGKCSGLGLRIAPCICEKR